MEEQTLKIKYPGEFLFSIKESKEEFENEAKMLLVGKLFKMKKISSGMAAKLLGMNRVQFLFSLGKYSIPVFDLTEDELERDIHNA